MIFPVRSPFTSGILGISYNFPINVPWFSEMQPGSPGRVERPRWPRCGAMRRLFFGWNNGRSSHTEVSNAGDLWWFNDDLMGFNGDLMGFMVISWEYYGDITGILWWYNDMTWEYGDVIGPIWRFPKMGMPLRFHIGLTMPVNSHQLGYHPYNDGECTHL